MAGYGEYILKLSNTLCILSKGKHLLVFNVQLCLIFERVSVMLKFLLLSLFTRVELMVMNNSMFYYEA